MVVFERDAAGNSASLTLNCNASGNPSPTIAWYREGTRLSNELVLANGSLVIVSITEGVDATLGGLSYHCTANNTFGIIRSRAANVSYACELGEEKEKEVGGGDNNVLCMLLNVFMHDVLSILDFDGFDGPNGTVMVNVTTADGDDDVALECHVQDANPPPQIRWLGNGIPLIQNTTNNLLRFLDNGRYLLITQLTTARVNTNYQCEVINARLHEAIRSPTMYDLVNNIGANEFMIYKRFINRTVLVGETVEMSYIAGAGAGIRPFVLDECMRSGSTLARSKTLVPQAGGIIVETIPRAGESIPPVGDNVTFEVSCTLFSGTNPNPSRATITLQGRC